MEKQIINIKIKGIIQKVISFYDLKSDLELFSKTRKSHICKARQICFFLLKTHTKLSLASIGALSLEYERENAYSHATVLHACKTVKNLCDVDTEIRNQVKYLNEYITGRVEFNAEEKEIELTPAQIVANYELIIEKNRLKHNKELDRLKTLEHPLFSELKGLNNLDLDLFYKNRWLPYKRTQGIKTDVKNINVVYEKIYA